MKIFDYFYINGKRVKNTIGRAVFDGLCANGVAIYHVKINHLHDGLSRVYKITL